MKREQKMGLCGRTVCLIVLLVFFFGGLPVQAAQENGIGTNTTGEERTLLEVGADEVKQQMIDRLDMDSIDTYIQKQDKESSLSFSTLVSELMSGGDTKLFQQIGSYTGDLLLGEIENNRELLIVMIALAFAFALLRNFSSVFQNSYVSQLCFLLVYVELMVLLMKSFAVVEELLTGTLDQIVEFMKVLLPVFSMSMVFSNGTTTASGFYEMAFLIIFLVQWVMRYLLTPLIQIYVVMQFVNYTLEGEKFAKMCELLEGGIVWTMKLTVTVVLGLNVVQGLVNPAIDRLKMSSLSKTVSMIPGFGNAAGSIGELLVGTGMVIKNSVGVAAMLILVILVLVPILKIFTLTFFYKLAAAVVEPVTDKRITGSMNGVFRGSLLAAKVMLTSLFLFFLTIAMITAASGVGV